MIKFPFKFRNQNEFWAWNQGCLWLSLDRFERFWPDVSLTLSNGPAVKSAIRAALRVEYAMRADFRAREAADPNCEDDLYWTDRLEALAQVCFRSLIDLAGAQDAESISRWMTGPVLGAQTEWTMEEHHWHLAWSDLLYRMGQEEPVEIESRYGIPDDSVRRIMEIAARFRREGEVNDERVQAADQEPLSGWDAVAYAEYRWECPQPSPLDGLSGHLRFICFDRALSDIISCTRPTDIDALIRYGRDELAPRLGIHDHRVIIPDDVRATWSELHVKSA